MRIVTSRFAPKIKIKCLNIKPFDVFFIIAALKYKHVSRIDDLIRFTYLGVA